MAHFRITVTKKVRTKCINLREVLYLGVLYLCIGTKSAVNKRRLKSIG